MKIKDTNYFWTVVEVNNLIPLENCDNVVGFPIFWYQAIVSKDTKEGDLMIVFPPESKLSHEYLSANNLYRHSELNEDNTKTWYFDDNWRIRAMKFRGHVSNVVAMPISSVSKFVKWSFSLNVWDEFTELDGTVIVSKYTIQRNTPIQNNRIWGKEKKYQRVDVRHFPEYMETEQFLRRLENYHDEDNIVVTQKLHGTSGRFWHIRVKNKPTFLDKIAEYFGYAKIDYEYIAWSRRVVKDTKSDQEFDHYYKSDIWNEALERVKHTIPKDTIIYAEIIGYTGETPIQKWYTYNLNSGEFEIFVYRIATVNEDGVIVDYSWEQILEYCRVNWLKSVPTMYEGKFEDFDHKEYIDKCYRDDFRNFHLVPLSDDSPCDEWICIRKEWILPYITKMKSPMFYEYETKQMDTWVSDMESNN